MSRQAVIPGATENPQGVLGGGGGGATKEAFRNPAVQRAIQRLRTKNSNLLDLAGGSLLAHDMYEYYVKPLFQKSLAAGDQDLRGLHAGGPSVRNGKAYGHPAYTWLMHAAATRCVDDYLRRHIYYILPQDELQKLANHLATNPADGGYGYLKRRFSQRINHYYIINRLTEIQGFNPVNKDIRSIIGIAGVLNDFQDAVAMKAENTKPKFYRLNHPAYVVPFNLTELRNQHIPPLPQ